MTKKLTKKEFIKQVERNRLYLLQHSITNAYDLNVVGGFTNQKIDSDFVNYIIKYTKSW